MSPAAPTTSRSVASATTATSDVRVRDHRTRARTAPRPSPLGRASIGTGLTLIVVGAVLLLAVDVPDEVTRYVDVLDLCLVLIWTGLLILGLNVWFHRAPSRTRRRRRGAEDVPPDDGSWRETDVHRPGYPGRTRQLPTIRDR